MIGHLLNSMRMQAQLQAGNRATVKLGLVDAYDPNNYAVKVNLQPENVITGWLPLASPWIGNGWGLHAPPSIGDMIEVQFQEGDIEAGFACQRFYNDSDRPLPCPSGEFWLVHQSGSLLKFHNDGSVELTSHANLTATVGGNLSAAVTGSATVTAQGGIVQDGAGAGATKGCVQGDCVCAFTGQPHPMISSTVKASV